MARKNICYSKYKGEIKILIKKKPKQKFIHETFAGINISLGILELGEQYTSNNIFI